MEKEDKIKAMELLINSHTVKQIAEFIVNLDESVEGLGKNNRALAEAYRKVLLKETKGEEDKEE